MGEDAVAEEKVELFTGLMGSFWQVKWVGPLQELAIRERDIQLFEQFVPLSDHFGGHHRLRPVQELRRVY